MLVRMISKDNGVRHAPGCRHPCKPLQGAICTRAVLGGCTFIPHIPSLEGSNAHFLGGLHVKMGECASMLCGRSDLQKLYLSYLKHLRHAVLVHKDHQPISALSLLVHRGTTSQKRRIFATVQSICATMPRFSSTRLTYV